MAQRSPASASPRSTPPASATTEDDGLLTASEVTTLALDADWVILSACNTASSDGGGEALSGLARAFFYAGARALLVSHWAVASDAATRITTDAFGVTAFVRRASAKDLDFELVTLEDDLTVVDILDDLRATPAVFIPSVQGRYSSMVTYGWLDSWKSSIPAGGQVVTKGHVKGLT